MTDELRQLMSASIGTEPPLGSPHAAVRRRAGRLRRRRQATGAAFAAATVGVTAVAIPALRPRERGSGGSTAVSSTAAAATASAEIPESEFEVNNFPRLDLATHACGYEVVASPGKEAGLPLDATGFGPGLDARAAGKDFVEVARTATVELGATFTPAADVASIDRIVIGLDGGLDDGSAARFYCELRDLPMTQLRRGQALRVHLTATRLKAATYKGVALSAYRTADGVRHPADAELGFYKFT
jgi:hypothetical protein